jgi:DNA mismatch endonuclease (patch repair protein)
MDTLSSERRSWLMSRVRSTNTMPELAIRRLIFGLGYRYRLHDKQLPGTPDLVFPGRLKVVFVNGCFWHGHDDCRYARLPKTRVRFWRAKIERNRSRDLENIEMLNAGGWQTLTIWQCELRDIEKLTRKIYGFFEEE